MRPACPLLVAFALASAIGTRTASAQDEDDGSYGRLSADTAVQLDLGAATTRGHAAGVGALALRYMQTAGAYATALTSRPHDDDVPRWRVSAGVELRPLFLPRFFKNVEQGPARWDLALDSLSLRVGAVTTDRHDGAPGLETGLTLGVPFTRSVDGPWLSAMGLLQWSHANLASDPHPTTIVGLTLGWQLSFDTHLVHVGDRPAR